MKFFSSKYKSTVASFLDKPTIDRYEWSLVIALTILLTLLLHANSLSGYWRFDDGFQLMFAVEYHPWQYFFDPAITRAQSGSNITPWSVLFYDLNLSLFSFEPSGFYGHLLLLIISTTIALYALLRLWIPAPPAILGIILFLTGKPTYYLSQQLMSNHYLTGLLFSLLSLIFFTNYLRHSNKINLLFAVIFYALATTCKEVYVPLIALLIVLPAGYFKQRLQAILPFILVAIAYALWRHEVLGAWLGGYKPNAGKADFIIEIQQLTNIPVILFDAHGWGLAGLIIILIMSLIAAWNRVLNIPLLIMAIFILFAPLIPLTLFPGINSPDRYLFAPWAAICILVAIIFQAPEKNQNGWFSRPCFFLKLISALVLIIASSIGHIHVKKSLKGSIHQSEAIYRFAIESDFHQKILMFDVKHKGKYWAFVSSEARRAYDITNNISPQPVLIIVNTLNGILLLSDMLQNETIDLSSVQFFHYINGSFRSINIKPIINSLLKSLDLGKRQLLQVKLSHQNGRLSWELQPSNKTYAAVVWQGKPGLQYPILKLPQKGSHPWSKEDKIQMSISFQNRQGWLAISPKINFNPKQDELVWQGKTDLALLTHQLESLLLRIDK